MTPCLIVQQVIQQQYHPQVCTPLLYTYQEQPIPVQAHSQQNYLLQKTCKQAVNKLSSNNRKYEDNLSKLVSTTCHSGLKWDNFDSADELVIPINFKNT